MAARSLRSWLKVEPHPIRIRATDAEGESHVIRIGESKSRWRDAEKALAGYVRCEALSAENEILRVWEDDEALAQVPSVTAAEGRTELAELARIITESNDAAVGRLVEIIQAALSANAALVHTLSERNRQLETAWQRLLNAREPGSNETPGSTGINEQLILGLLSGLVTKPQTPNGG